MANNIYAQFIVGGVLVGNKLTVAATFNGSLQVASFSGDFGLTVVQAQTAKLRVWCEEDFSVTDFGYTNVLMKEVAAPAIAYTAAATGLSSAKALLLLE